jgi:hypothetical protein
MMGFRWQEADLLGITVGAGNATAQLNQGSVRTGVIEAPVSGGTLRIEPILLLNQHPPRLNIAPGQVLENVQITAGMCDRWLKYVAPVVADTTQAEGTFSASLGATAIPLHQPLATRAEGILEVHTATIGPGPMARQLIQAAATLQTVMQLSGVDVNALHDPWVKFPPQQARCWLSDQRVYHEQLVFTIGKVVIQTRGSVGLDQSLSMEAQIPIQPQWIADRPKLSFLRGHTVRLPITGTLGNPRVDQRGLQQLATDILQSATGSMIQDGIRQGLDQLFRSQN